jgi:ketosteroid isomerase-like protein
MNNSLQIYVPIIYSLFLLLFIGCSNQNGTNELDKEDSLSQTREILSQHVQAHYDADAKSATALYIDDFKFYGMDNQTYRNREEVEKMYSDLYNAVEIKELVYQYEDFDIAGNQAIEMGKISLTIKPKGAENDTLINSKERYLVIWEHDDIKGWQLVKGISVAYD